MTEGLLDEFPQFLLSPSKDARYLVTMAQTKAGRRGRRPLQKWSHTGVILNNPPIILNAVKDLIVCTH